MVEKTIVAKGVIYGPWHKGPAAPNGSVPGELERLVTKYELYEADFYGKGSKLYLYIVYLLEFPSGNMSVVNTFDTGNAETISAFLAANSLLVSL